MKEYIFSSAQNMFYPIALKRDYVLSGSWPEDGVFVGVDLFREFTETPPVGKVRGVGADGMPEWRDYIPINED